MPKNNVTQYSTTAASNTDVGGINTDEGCAASGINNAIREIMKHTADWVSGSQAVTALTVTGEVDAGSLDISGNADIDGITNLDAVNIDGGFSQTGGHVTFNSAAADYDFRIASVNNTHMVAVDAALNAVGIGTGSPDSNHELEIASTGAVEVGLRSVDDGATMINFGQASDRLRGRIYYTNAATEYMTFNTNGNGEKVRIGGPGGSAGVLFVNTTTVRNVGCISVDYAGNSMSGMGINDTDSGNGSKFISFLSGGTYRGGITNNANVAVAYNTTSDYRLKENVSYTFDATSRLKQLKPARFNWISDETNTIVDGFLAHEVSSIVPEAIDGEKDAVEDVGTMTDSGGNQTENVPKNQADDSGNSWVKTGTKPVLQGIDQSKLVPLLVKTIQELEARITALESA